MTRVTLLAPSLQVARPLQDALALRGVPTDVAVPQALTLDFAVRRRTDTVVNLFGRDVPPDERLLLADVLAWLADIEASVVNGLDAFVVGSSPARQLALLDHLGLPHPPARVAGSRVAVAGALEQLGLDEAEAEVLPGPPVVVRARVAGVRTLAYVGGRLLAGGPVPETMERAAADVLGTAGIELGTVRIAESDGGWWWLGADGSLPGEPAVVGAAAEYVRFRAGL